MMKFLAVASGGAIGTVLRYVVGTFDFKFSTGIFPVSTLIVNATGSLLIGLLWGVADHFIISLNMRLFLFIGILGGYTTFSTFSLESFHLLKDGAYRVALMNIIISNILAIAFVFLGFFISRIVTRLFT